MAAPYTVLVSIYILRISKHICGIQPSITPASDPVHMATPGDGTSRMHILHHLRQGYAHARAPDVIPGTHMPCSPTALQPTLACPAFFSIVDDEKRPLCAIQPGRWRSKRSSAGEQRSIQSVLKYLALGYYTVFRAEKDSIYRLISTVFWFGGITQMGLTTRIPCVQSRLPRRRPDLEKQQMTRLLS